MTNERQDVIDAFNTLEKSGKLKPEELERVRKTIAGFGINV